jgi:hypothetical protein
MDELEDFKSAINLTEYAAAKGYVLDKRASSRNSALMKNASGDKIVIARGADRHWIYFSVRDDTDNGTIIDFVQNRKGVKLGGVRQELRPWVGSARAIARPQPDLFAPTLKPITKDRARVLLELARCKPLLTHPYLEEGRGLPAALLRSSRFAGKIKTDHRRNAIFPHADADGPCGYEIKNFRFTGFSPGGDKGLWFSAAKKDDQALVIAESGIDALSYGALFPDEHARYASIGGAMNPGQPALIAAAIQKMGQGARIVAAMDNDAPGRDLAERIEAIARETGRADLSLARHLPEAEGADWNDVVRASRAAEAPAPAALP